VIILTGELKNPAKTHILNPEVALGANRTYKDSVFSLLFNHPEALR
jgi:hypothetical protein